MKLVTYPALFRAQKVIITAQYAKVALEVDTNTSESQLAALSVHGKVPCLVTPEGNLSESNAIARYIGRMAPASLNLCGALPFEQAKVDSWLDFCVQDLEIPATLWIAPILGWMDSNAEVSKRACEDLKKGLAVLEEHLKMETFIVGRQITLADIAIATTLILPLKLVMDEKQRKPFPNVLRWFDMCVNQQEFIDVVGTTALCVTPVEAPKASAAAVPAAAAPVKDEKKAAAPKAEKAAAAPKAEKAAAAPKAEKRKQDDAVEEEPEISYEDKKTKNPLDDLPKSTFNLDAWKREYSNCPNNDTNLAMPYFWDNFDSAGYSLWICSYNFNAECKVAFMTGNLVAGFVQRSDSIRKYAFGVMQVLEGPTSQQVIGAWLFRGQSTDVMLKENDDAEYYTWTKLESSPTAEQKARLQELWCADESITVDGQALKILDCKVFK